MAEQAQWAKWPYSAPVPYDLTIAPFRFSIQSCPASFPYDARVQAEEGW